MESAESNYTVFVQYMNCAKYKSKIVSRDDNTNQNVMKVEKWFLPFKLQKELEVELMNSTYRPHIYTEQRTHNDKPVIIDFLNLVSENSCHNEYKSPKSLFIYRNENKRDGFFLFNLRFLSKSSGVCEDPPLTSVSDPIAQLVVYFCYILRQKNFTTLAESLSIDFRAACNFPKSEFVSQFFSYTAILLTHSVLQDRKDRVLLFLNYLEPIASTVEEKDCITIMDSIKICLDTSKAASLSVEDSSIKLSESVRKFLLQVLLARPSFIKRVPEEIWQAYLEETITAWLSKSRNMNDSTENYDPETIDRLLRVRDLREKENVLLIPVLTILIKDISSLDNLFGLIERMTKAEIESMNSVMCSKLTQILSQSSTVTKTEAYIRIASSKTMIPALVYLQLLETLINSTSNARDLESLFENMKSELEDQAESRQLLESFTIRLQKLVQSLSFSHLIKCLPNLHKLRTLLTQEMLGKIIENQLQTASYSEIHAIRDELLQFFKEYSFTRLILSSLLKMVKSKFTYDDFLEILVRNSVIAFSQDTWEGDLFEGFLCPLVDKVLDINQSPEDVFKSIDNLFIEHITDQPYQEDLCKYFWQRYQRKYGGRMLPECIQKAQRCSF